MAKNEQPQPPVQHIDLRAVTRPGCLTRVLLDTDDYRLGLVEWFTCGKISIHRWGSGGNRSILSVRAREGVVDPEFDSADVLRLPLIGTGVEFVDNGWTYLHACVGGSAREFRFPPSGYDPEKLPGVQTRNGLTIIPEGFYAGPKGSPELWNTVVGKRVEIRIGPES